MSNWNFSIGRCFGTPVTVHWTFLLVLLFQVIFTLISHAQSWKYILVMAVAYGPVLLLSVLFHELGHIWLTKRFNGSVIGSMMLWPLGGLTQMKIVNGTCMQEFWVSLCGPLMHIPQMFVWLGVMAIAQSADYFGQGFYIDQFDDGGADLWFAELAKQALLLNMMLFFANLLIPAYPMDSARLLASLSVHFGLTVTKAAYVIVGAGCLVGLIGLALGLVYLIKGSGPGFLLLFLGLYCLYNGYNLYQSIQDNNHRQHPVFAPDCYKNTNPIPPPVQEEQAKKKAKNSKNNKYTRDEETGDASPYDGENEPKPSSKKKAPKKKAAPQSETSTSAKKTNKNADAKKKPVPQKKKAPIKKVPATTKE